MIWHPSPNFGARRGCAAPDLIVLHYTAMESAEAALERLCDPGPEVSAHWLVARDGRVFHLVDEVQRAWHAGRGAWGRVTDVNSHSIGIEIDNDGSAPFAAAAMTSVERLVEACMARWAIPVERVIGHSDCAPGRKTDPGRRFDWQRLVRQGLAVGATRDSGSDLDFWAALRAFGYPEADQGDLLGAFRSRFRPWAVGGAPDDRDLAIARDLALRFPVDPTRAQA